MPTVIIEGYDYGSQKPIGLILTWYIYGGAFIQYRVSSFGAFVPQIQLSDEGGNVVIFINDRSYYERFTVRAFAAGAGELPGWFNGWNAVDQPLTGTNTVTVPYENDFSGNVYFSGGIWNGDGNIGIGTTIPSSRLEVNGAVTLTANSGGSIKFPDGTTQTTAWTGVLCGGDYAEAVEASGAKEAYEPGDVLVITEGKTGDVEKATDPYSTTVAGIFATKPGVIGRRDTLSKTVEDLPMAMVGIVPTKVSAENGPIRRGDLLVSSSTPGYAMKGTDRSKMLGAVIGKAMGSLRSGRGVVEVLVTLQ